MGTRARTRAAATVRRTCGEGVITRHRRAAGLSEGHGGSGCVLFLPRSQRLCLPRWQGSREAHGYPAPLLSERVALLLQCSFWLLLPPPGTCQSPCLCLRPGSCGPAAAVGGGCSQESGAGSGGIESFPSSHTATLWVIFLNVAPGLSSDVVSEKLALA